MTSAARQALLERVVDDVARHGIGDRSLRDIAASVATSHRMLLYHFGSRGGLVAAIVAEVERQQRDALARLATTASDAPSLIRALWRDVSAPERRSVVRLFFEAVAASEPSTADLTEAWLEDRGRIEQTLGSAVDPVSMRLGVAVIRGLLIDVLTTGDVTTATAALERYIGLSGG